MHSCHVLWSLTNEQSLSCKGGRCKDCGRRRLEENTNKFWFSTNKNKWWGYLLYTKYIPSLFSKIHGRAANKEYQDKVLSPKLECESKKTNSKIRREPDKESPQKSLKNPGNIYGNYTTHCWRHSAATNLTDRGVFWSVTANGSQIASLKDTLQTVNQSGTKGKHAYFQPALLNKIKLMYQKCLS